MPHLVLEYSNNALNAEKIGEVLASLHKALAGAGVDETRIKTRGIKLEDYIVGSSEKPDASMMHVTLALLEGRDDLTKKKYGEVLREILLKSSKEECQVTVEVRDMRRDTYLM